MRLKRMAGATLFFAAIRAAVRTYEPATPKLRRRKPPKPRKRLPKTAGLRLDMILADGASKGDDLRRIARMSGDVWDNLFLGVGAQTNL
jgi:hypothetical protein